MAIINLVLFFDLEGKDTQTDYAEYLSKASNTAINLVGILGKYIPFNIFWLLSASKPKCNFCHWSKMTLKSSSYLLPKFSRVSLTIVLIKLISTIVNGTLLNFGKGHFWSVAKVALRFGCVKQSKNLEFYLIQPKLFWFLAAEFVAKDRMLVICRRLEIGTYLFRTVSCFYGTPSASSYPISMHT